MAFLIITVLFIALTVVSLKLLKANSLMQEKEKRERELDEQLTNTINENTSLSRFRTILDAEAKAKEIMEVAAKELERARAEVREEKNAATQNVKEKLGQAEARLQTAVEEARRIIDDANLRAEEIAGDAFKAKGKADLYEQTVRAMKNLIEGYGDQYIVPTYSLLDELAESYGFAEAGEALKKARERARQMVKQQRAAMCDYVEENRKETAIRFVADAFNGKVDSILSRVKADNFGTLRQQIEDAFNLVNFNGASFRNARITPEYRDARIDELKWGVITYELREKERDEQRRIKEQIREEERARREYERAIKEAAKDEEALKKAMDKMQQQVAEASETQKAAYEAKLNELQEKLNAAEEKNQRALSMAQQTRSGHVYIISNIGSFGEQVFKIGMTRRLEPADRIRELGDASVPFPFDVHAMMFSEDAPALERSLHKAFLVKQINKVNPRKEFFRVDLRDIKDEIERVGIAAHWTITAEAYEYRETLSIEKSMKENAIVEQEWMNNQMKYEPELVVEDEPR